MWHSVVMMHASVCHACAGPSARVNHNWDRGTGPVKQSVRSGFRVHEFREDRDSARDSATAEFGSRAPQVLNTTAFDSPYCIQSYVLPIVLACRITWVLVMCA